MAEPFSMTVDTTRNVTFVRLRGGMVYGQDMHGVHDTLVRLLAEGHTRIVLDMSAVEATDSSGISTLLDARHIMGKSVVLLRPSEHLRGTLTVTRTLPLFEIVDDEAQLAGSDDG